MNYRHAYHAGNFADVLKHVILAWVISYMCRKPKPFRIIDTHAGIGTYDLSGEEAEKTGEWCEGIGRLRAAKTPAFVAPHLAPYLNVLGQLNAGTRITQYPGSPLVARKLMREKDKLVVNEMHPDDYASLRELFSGDRQTKVMSLDGWIAIKSLLPPPERRGIILIDPPFEMAGDYDRLVEALVAGTRRFATGVFLLWYPIKDPIAVREFKSALVATGLNGMLCAELNVGFREDLATGLNAAGVIVHNPPFGLSEVLPSILEYLRGVLSRGGPASAEVSWVVA